MFDNVRLNPLLSRGFVGGPGHTTIIQVSQSQHERRLQRSSRERRRYTVAKRLMTASAWGELLAFWLARKGALRSFRFKDWSDYTSNPTNPTAPPTRLDQLIGIGDGVTKTFKLLKVYGVDVGLPLHARRISLPVAGTLVVAVNGVASLEPAWALSIGEITFATAPAVGHEIRCGFEFDVEVRFDRVTSEGFNVRMDVPGRFDVQDLALVEVLDEAVTPEIGSPGGSTNLDPLSVDRIITVYDGMEILTNPTVAVSLYLQNPTGLGGGRYWRFHVKSGAAGTIRLYSHEGVSLTSALGSGQRADVALFVDSIGEEYFWHVSY